MHGQSAPSHTVEDSRLDVAGGPIAVCRVRPDGASANRWPTLVFLHEALGCIDMWKDVPARLSRVTGLPALVYDRHGHGRSGALTGPRRADYLDREALEVLPQVLSACDVGEPLLIGHSDGGTIALLYAAEHSARAVVSEAGHVFVEPETRAGIRDAVAAWRTTDLAARLARYHGDKTEVLFFAWADTWLADDFASWDISDRLPAVTCPVLAVQGEADEYGTARQLAAIADGVSGEVRTVMLPDCGHVPHIQAAEGVVGEIAGFIAGLPD